MIASCDLFVSLAKDFERCAKQACRGRHLFGSLRRAAEHAGRVAKVAVQAGEIELLHSDRLTTCAASLTKEENSFKAWIYWSWIVVPWLKNEYPKSFKTYTRARKALNAEIQENIENIANMAVHYDGPDWLVWLQLQAGDYSDACRLMVRLLRKHNVIGKT